MESGRRWSPVRAPGVSILHGEIASGGRRGGENKEMYFELCENPPLLSLQQIFGVASSVIRDIRPHTL